MPRPRRSVDRVHAAPTATATIVFDRTVLVLGTEQSVAITIEVRGADTAGLRVDRAVASVGKIEDQRAGSDRFRARYLAPPTRYPQVAILVIDLVQVAGSQRIRAAARLPLHAATQVPFRTSPRAAVTMRIADRTFGPVGADNQARRIPASSLPACTTGWRGPSTATATRARPPSTCSPAPFNRLLVVTASEAEAGSFVDVSVFGLDARGEPLATGHVALTASGGLVHPLGAGAPGEERFLLEAPRRVDAGPLSLVATTTPEPPAKSGGAPARSGPRRRSRSSPAPRTSWSWGRRPSRWSSVTAAAPP